MQSISNENLNEIKTQLITREGEYELIPSAEYTRPKTSSYSSNSSLGGASGGGGTGGCSNTTPVRISFTKLCIPDHTPPHATSNNNNHNAIANPFLPTTYYHQTSMNRLSHSNETLNHLVVGNEKSLSFQANGTIGSAYHHHVNNSNSGNHHRSSDQHLIQQHKNSNNNYKNNINEIHIDERICFNVGREIFIYSFNGLQVWF